MSANLQAYEPLIRQILTDPKTDLSVISAKRVRKALLDLDSSITSDFIKEHKKALDGIIGAVFESVRGDQEFEDDATGPEPIEPPTSQPVPLHSRDKRKREVADDGEDDSAYLNGNGASSPPAKKHKPKAKSKGKAMTDEEYARQLSAEINAIPTRSGVGPASKPRKGGSRSPKKVKKSRAEIEDDSDGAHGAFNDDDDDDDSSGGKKKKPKKGGGGGKGGFQKELLLSEPLAALLGTDRLSRPQVVKQLWEYIKGKELQNPANRRQIMCDVNLRAIFQIDKVDMFTMNKLLKSHLFPTS